MKRLAGKVALVAAGPDGVDIAAVRALADDGAAVAISYSAGGYEAKALVRELKDKGVRAAAFLADDCDAAQLERLFKAVIERFGRLDLLIWRPVRTSSDYTNSSTRSMDYPLAIAGGQPHVVATPAQIPK